MPRRPNPQLAAARRARGLTQHELAEAASRISSDAGESAIDANYISKLERGVIRRPQRRYRDALRVALGVRSDADLGFALYPRTVTDGGEEAIDVRRIEFLQSAVGLGLGSVLGDPGRWVAGRNGDVGTADVELVRGVTVASRALRGVHGGAACTRGVAAQVEWAIELLDRPCAGGVRARLLAAVSAMASMAAWGAVDAGQHHEAHRFHRLALGLADTAEGGALRAEVRKDAALAALYNGDSAAALGFVGQARADVGAAPPTGRVLLAAAEVRALVAAARPAAAERALSDVSASVEDPTSAAPESGDGSYFAEATTSDLRYEVALAAHALASSAPTRGAVAVTHIDRCLNDAGLPGVRRARMTTKLAHVQTLSGDLERGLISTDRAVALATDAGRSRLLDVDLKNLNSALRRHTGKSTAPQRQRLAALLGAAV